MHVTRQWYTHNTYYILYTRTRVYINLRVRGKFIKPRVCITSTRCIASLSWIYVFSTVKIYHYSAVYTGIYNTIITIMYIQLRTCEFIITICGKMYALPSAELVLTCKNAWPYTLYYILYASICHTDILTNIRILNEINWYAAQHVRIITYSRIQILYLYNSPIRLIFFFKSLTWLIFSRTDFLLSSSFVFHHWSNHRILILYYILRTKYARETEKLKKF